MSNELRGIDISKHQGEIDEAFLRNQVDFAILRSSYRKMVDPRFQEYLKKLRTVNIWIPAIYHFSYAENEMDAYGEGKFAATRAIMEDLPKETVIFYDFEYDTVQKAKANGVTLDAYDCQRFTEAFCRGVKELGFHTGVYCNKDFYKNWYKGSFPNNVEVIWLADYVEDSSDLRDNISSPTFPCHLRQYSSKGSVAGITGHVDLNIMYDPTVFKMKEEEEKVSKKRLASEVINLARSWVGKNEADGSYKEIIDIYNSYAGTFPRGVKMQYNWAWCACTWSALAIKLGYTDIMPIEISCGELIEAAKKMNIWVEEDGHVPYSGDAVLYDWGDSGSGDNAGWPDHIGLVEEVCRDAGYFVVIEGNYDDSVKRRTVSVNGKFIRGFITPNYDKEDPIYAPAEKLSNEELAHQIIAGLWGNGKERKETVEFAGYNYEEVQKLVNSILNDEAVVSNGPVQSEDQPVEKTISATCNPSFTMPEFDGWYIVTSDLYCRNDAGSNKKALCIIPENTRVYCDGNLSIFDMTIWPLVTAKIDGVLYRGFVSGKYLEKE